VEILLPCTNIYKNLDADTLNYSPLLGSVFKLKFIGICFVPIHHFMCTSTKIFVSCLQNCRAVPMLNTANVHPN